MSGSGAPPPLGILAGSGFLEGIDPAALGVPVRRVEVDTPRGRVAVQRTDDFVFLRRHGEGVPHLPHRVPHHAHVLALEALGVREAVGLASTGSLHPHLGPGTVVVPDDYLSRHAPPTFAEDEALHIVPELDSGLRRLLVAAARAAMGRESPPSGPLAPDPPAGGVEIQETGVYAETRGPRFETRAEVRSLARDAAVVGMTAASEATLCQERGIRYAILCLVDNWAHGVAEEPLTLEGFRIRQEENRHRAGAILLEIVRTPAAARGYPAPHPTPSSEESP